MAPPTVCVCGLVLWSVRLTWCLAARALLVHASQENVQAESAMMVPDCRMRLETALAELQTALVRSPRVCGHETLAHARLTSAPPQAEWADADGVAGSEELAAASALAAEVAPLFD